MYFKNLPKFEYDFGTTTKMVDVFRRISFTEETKNSLDAFRSYVVKSGKTPDDVANEVYGDAGWFWLVLMSNNIINVETEWPRSQTKMQRQFTDTGFLSGSSLFSYENRDFQKGDIIVKATSCTEGENGCDETGVTAEADNYAIIDEWHPNLFKINVKLKGPDFLLKGDDRDVLHYRKSGDNFSPVPSIFSGCSGDSNVFRIEKNTDIIKGLDKFKYGNMEVSPFSQITGGGPLPDGPPDATNVPYLPVYSDAGLCGLTGTLLYKYMTDNQTIPAGFETVTVEDSIYKEEYEKSKIKLLHPRLLIGLYDEFKMLMSSDSPRGTTRIIEFKG